MRRVLEDLGWGLFKMGRFWILEPGGAVFSGWWFEIRGCEHVFIPLGTRGSFVIGCLSLLAAIVVRFWAGQSPKVISKVSSQRLTSSLSD